MVKKRPIYSRINAVSNVFICFIKKWWIPIACAAIAGTMIVHGIVIPLMTKSSSDLIGLSALVTAVSAAFAAVAWRKSKGDE